MGDVDRADGGTGDDASSVTAGSTAVVLGGGGTNQTFPITAGKARGGLKRLITADTPVYHLTRSALRQV